MRPPESLSIALLAPVSATWSVHVAMRGRRIRATVAGVLLALGGHLALAGHRGPMVPAYTLAAVLTLRAIWGCL